MALNEQELKIAKGMKADGYSTDEVMSEIGNYRESLGKEKETPFPTSSAMPKAPDMVSGPQLNKSYNKDEHTENISRISLAKNLASDTLGGIWNFAGGAATGLTGDIPSVMGLLTKLAEGPSSDIKKPTTAGEDALAGDWSNLIPKLVYGITKDPVYKDKTLSEVLMEAGEEIPDYLQTSIGVDPEATTTKVGEFFTPDVMLGLGKAYKGYKASKTTEAIASKLDEKIINDFTKAIKPSTAGKDNIGKIEKYNEKARDAISNITLRKNDIHITDKYGEALPGKLPETTKQFSEAVGSLKSDIYKKYHKIAEDAGEKLEIKFQPVIDELNKLKKDDVFIKTASDVEIKHIDDIINQLSKGGGKSSILDTEAIKQVYNSRLNQFYKSGDYANVGKSSIDAMVNNKIGGLLDETISGVGSRQYSELKGIYGNLSTIEKDVAHRAIMEARKDGAGLLDYTSIVSARDVAGALSGADAGIGLAKAGTSETLKLYYKYITSPDVKIKNMFKNSEKFLDIADFR